MADACGPSDSILPKVCGEGLDERQLSSPLMRCMDGFLEGVRWQNNHEDLHSLQQPS